MLDTECVCYTDTPAIDGDGTGLAIAGLLGEAAHFDNFPAGRWLLIKP